MDGWTRFTAFSSFYMGECWGVSVVNWLQIPHSVYEEENKGVCVFNVCLLKWIEHVKYHVLLSLNNPEINFKIQFDAWMMTRCLCDVVEDSVLFVITSAHLTYLFALGQFKQLHWHYIKSCECIKMETVRSVSDLHVSVVLDWCFNITCLLMMQVFTEYHKFFRAQSGSTQLKCLVVLPSCGLRNLPWTCCHSFCVPLVASVITLLNS